MRCVLEARLHDQNSFITLTYSDEHLPKDLSLDKTHLQKFFKRLRKQKGPFRYYACGEYGDNTQRAHYHACLFGMDFQDKVELRRINEHTLYHSEELDKIWGYGHCSVGELTFQSAAYCARYVLKKHRGKSTDGGQQIQRRSQHAHQEGLAGKGGLSQFRLDEETGELIPVVQPYAVMSLATAIAKQWLSKNHGDIYNADKDFLAMRGQKLKPPKYFDRLYDTINPARLEKIKKRRKEERTELSLQELRAHEKITRARIIQRKQV